MFKIKYIVLTIIGVILLLIGMGFHELNSIRIRQTKDYAELYIEQTDIVDYQMFLNPIEKFSTLNQIDLDMRLRVAKYMQKNNLKLDSGKQEFIRNNPTYEELIENFRFKPL